MSSISSTTSYSSIFSEEQLSYLLNLPEVSDALQKLNNHTVYFTVTLTDSIKQTLFDRLGLDLSSLSHIPMRWIKGDTPSHVDLSSQSFEKTYLVYLNDSVGSLVVDGQSFPISENTGYIFDESLPHFTEGTGDTPRLLLGPMSESGISVGGPILAYYNTEADALLGGGNYIAYGDWTIGNIFFGSLGSITQWKIASNSSGTSSQLSTYNIGDVLISDGSYYMYPAPGAICLLEGTGILCADGILRPIERLEKGMLVKTLEHGDVAVDVIGKSVLHHKKENDPRDRLFVYKGKKGEKDLVLTGGHSVLVDHLTVQQAKQVIELMGAIFMTDTKFRLPACLDEKALPYEKDDEVVNIYHICLVNEDPKLNYGVYADGILVETCQKECKFSSTMMVITFLHLWTFKTSILNKHSII